MRVPLSSSTSMARRIVALSLVGVLLGPSSTVVGPAVAGIASSVLAARAASHHHPGCPWRAHDGPCPHRMAVHASDGPAWSTCAADPLEAPSPMAGSGLFVVSAGVSTSPPPPAVPVARPPEPLREPVAGPAIDPPPPRDLPLG